jgi:hypothetical protein
MRIKEDGNDKKKVQIKDYCQCRNPKILDDLYHPEKSRGGCQKCKKPFSSNFWGGYSAGMHISSFYDSRHRKEYIDEITHIIISLQKLIKVFGY